MSARIPTGKQRLGPIVWNDIYDGETYDARLERSGWDSPGYDDADWRPAEQAQIQAARWYRRQAVRQSKLCVDPASIHDP